MDRLAALILVSSLSLFSASCGSACLRQFRLVGTVIDASSAAIPQADVRWGGSPNSVLGRTDINGQYSISYETYSPIEGAVLEFYKYGYTATQAPVFTADEAGEEICGEVTLTRNAVLSP